MLTTSSWLVNVKLSATFDDELAKLGIVKHDKKVKIIGNAFNIYKRKHVEDDDNDVEEITDYGNIAI